MSDFEAREFSLDTLEREDVIYCPDCAILILRYVRPVEFPLIGKDGLYCPICDRMLLSKAEIDSQDDD